MKLVFALIAAVALSACASQTTAPAEKSAGVTKTGPQCWSGDHDKFFNVGDKTTLAGVSVECKPTSDGKAAQWMGNKH
jgi:hypothetical protein